MAHPSLVKGVGLGVRSKEAIDREWNDLAARLNAHGSGATKTGQRWKRYWADLKFKIKSKAAARRREASGTGGGPATLDDLSETESKVLAIIGEGAVYGDTQHRVPLFISSTQHSTDQTQSSISIPTQSTISLNDEEIEASTEVMINTTESPPPSTSGSFQHISPSTRGHTSSVNTTEAIAAAPGSLRRPPTTARRLIVTTGATAAPPGIPHPPPATARQLVVTTGATAAPPGIPHPPPAIARQFVVTTGATAAASGSPCPPPATARQLVDNTEATAAASGSPRRSPATARRLFESPASRRQRRQPRHSSSSTVTRVGRTDQRVEPSWVVELERRRVDAESRLADAAVITAEASRIQAEASRMQAEASRMQAEAMRDHAAALYKLLEILCNKNN